MAKAKNEFSKRYFRLDRKAISYVRFICESYDGLLFMRTLNPRTAIIEVGWPPSRARDAEELLQALIDETGMAQVPLPVDDYTPL